MTNPIREFTFQKILLADQLSESSKLVGIGFFCPASPITKRTIFGQSKKINEKFKNKKGRILLLT